MQQPPALLSSKAFCCSLRALRAACGQSPGARDRSKWVLPAPAELLQCWCRRVGRRRGHFTRVTRCCASESAGGCLSRVTAAFFSGFVDCLLTRRSLQFGCEIKAGPLDLFLQERRVVEHLARVNEDGDLHEHLGLFSFQFSFLTQLMAVCRVSQFSFLTQMICRVSQGSLSVQETLEQPK